MITLQSNDATNIKKQPEKDKSRFLTLIVVVLCSFITTFTGSALNLSIPDISTEFNAGAVIIGWIVTGYIMSSAVLAVPFGRFADLKGKKPVLIAGIIIFGICSALCACSWSIEAIVTFRLLQGVGAAMIFCTNQAILISTYPPEDRGRVLGYAISSTYLGLSLGPVVGGFLNHSFGWRSIFILTCAVSVLIFFIAIKNLPSIQAESGFGMDKTGNILYILMLFCIMYGLNAISSNPYAKWLLISGALLLALFIFHELKEKSPIVNVRLFKDNLIYTFSNITALLNYGASYALSYLISIYFQTVLGMDSQISGLILVANPLMMTILSPYAGKLSDRISPYKLTSFGMALTTVGLFMCSFIKKDFPLWMVVVDIVIIGIGFAFFSSPNTNSVMACVDKKDYSVASSILATMRSIGHTLSMAVVTYVVSVNIGNIPIADADHDSILKTMHICFLIFTGLCLVGTFISSKRK